MTIKEKTNFLTSRGVSITELAKRTNCNSSTLARWLRGESNLSTRLEKDLHTTILNFVEEIQVLRE